MEKINSINLETFSTRAWKTLVTLLQALLTFRKRAENKAKGQKVLIKASYKENHQKLGCRRKRDM